MALDLLERVMTYMERGKDRESGEGGSGEGGNTHVKGGRSGGDKGRARAEEHKSEVQSLRGTSYVAFCRIKNISF